MKKALIILIAILVSLSGHAQGSIQKSLLGNPKIDSLLRYARSLDCMPREQYTFDGIYKKSFICTLWSWMSDHRLLVDSIRHTCMELTDYATESYIKECHQDGKDSLVYVITLGENKEPHLQLQNAVQNSSSRASAYVLPHTPESMILHYYPSPNHQADASESPQHIGQFFHYYQKEGGGSIQPVFVDVKAYKKILEKVFNKKGVHQQHCHIRKDSTYVFDDEHEKWTIGAIHNDHKWASDTKVTIYTFSSNELAMDMYKILHDHTWQFIEDHPATRCSFRLDTTTNSLPVPMFSSETQLENNLLHKFVVYFAMDIDMVARKHEYYIVVFDIKKSEWGTEFLPENWKTLKSWVNGKTTYYKK